MFLKGEIGVKVGFIGIGVMGSRMVQRFLNAGYDVSIYSRTKEKAKPFVEQGVELVETIGDLSAKADIICTCLSMPSDVEEVYLGENGILAHAKSHSICVDFTTVGKKTSNEVYERAKEKEISYLDAPVSGGPEGVEQGTLTIMVGGDKDAFEKVESLLKSIGSAVEYLGASGSGSIAKLMNQYLVAVHTLAASEVMVTGTALGLNPEQLYNLLKVSYGDSRMLRRHMEEYVLDRQFEPGGALKYIHKDVRLANELTEQVGLESPSGRLAEAALKEAMEKGLEDKDMSSLIQSLEEKCGVVVKR